MLTMINMHRYLRAFGATCLQRTDLLGFFCGRLFKAKLGSKLPANRTFRASGNAADRFLIFRVLNARAPRALGHVGRSPENPPVISEATVCEFTIQRHLAKRAGLHYDLRLIFDGKAYSWASRKPMAKALFLQPPHSPAYAHWEGAIEEGYGAGKVTLWDSGKCICRTSPSGTLHVQFFGEKTHGSYALVAQKGYSLCVKEKRQVLKTQSANMYTTKIPDEIWNDPNVICENKIDGANFSVRVDPKGLVFVSRRLSVDGRPIDRTDNVPHLRNLRLPRGFHGAVVQGELAYTKDKGGIPVCSYETASGILNSLPPNAVETQRRIGKLRFFPFEVIRAPGVSKTATYAERRGWLQAFVHACNSPNVRLPEGRTSRKEAWYKKIVRTKTKILGQSRVGEGVVLKRLDGDRRSESFKWPKAKTSDTWDLVITGFTPGEGRFEDKGVGALMVSDRTARLVGRVGSGLTDEDRFAAFRHPRRYLGRVVEVKAMSVTGSGNLRAPRFHRWRPDKTAKMADIIIPQNVGQSNRSIPQEARLGEVIRAQDPGISPRVLKDRIYAMKTAAGWRSK